MKTLEITLTIVNNDVEELINFNINENSSLFHLFHRIINYNKNFINYYYNYDETLEFIKNNEINDSNEFFNIFQQYTENIVKIEINSKIIDVKEILENFNINCKLVNIF